MSYKFRALNSTFKEIFDRTLRAYERRTISSEAYNDIRRLLDIAEDLNKAVNERYLNPNCE